MSQDRYKTDQIQCDVGKQDILTPRLVESWAWSTFQLAIYNPSCRQFSWFNFLYRRRRCGIYWREIKSRRSRIFEKDKWRQAIGAGQNGWWSQAIMAGQSGWWLQRGKRCRTIRTGDEGGQLGLCRAGNDGVHDGKVGNSKVGNGGAGDGERGKIGIPKKSSPWDFLLKPALVSSLIVSSQLETGKFLACN